MKKIITNTVFLILFLFIPLLISATVYTTISDGNWADGANWDQGSPPSFGWGNSDEVYVKHEMTLTADVSMQSSYVEISSSGKILGNNTFKITMTNLVQIINDGEINVKQISTGYQKASLRNNADLITNDGLSISGSMDTILNYGTMVIGGDVSTAGGDVFGNFNDMTINGNFVNGGLSSNYDKLVINGDFTENTSNNFFNSEDANLKVANVLKITGSTGQAFRNRGYIETDSLDVNSDTLSNFHQIKILNGGNVAGGFLVNQSSGIFQFGDNLKNSNTITNNNTIYVDGGAIDNSGGTIDGTNGDICQSDGISAVTVTGGSNNNSSCLKGANTLPVNIISFDYSIVKDNVELYWQTASEVNNNYFEVQRSYNLQDWEMVSNLDGNGNSNVIINYSIVDANFDRSKDVIYYRLVQVDFDGRINYYRFLVVNYSNKNYEIIVFPNPALYTDAINVYFSGDQNFDAQLLDQYGGLIMKMENNHKQLTIDKGRLARGLYYIKISCYNVEEVRKIIVF